MIYDIEVVEAHHRMKKDAPSGTAMKLGQVLAEAVNRDFGEVGVFARKGLIGERTRKEIGMQTIRAGTSSASTRFIFGGLGERLEVTHRAHSRDNLPGAPSGRPAGSSARSPGCMICRMCWELNKGPRVQRFKRNGNPLNLWVRDLIKRKEK